MKPWSPTPWDWIALLIAFCVGMALTMILLGF